MKEKTGLKMERWQIEYNQLMNYAITHKMRNLRIALELAVKYHDGQYRDGGEPFIIHPLMVCKILMLLNVEKYLKAWYPEKSDSWIRHQCDVLLAASVLHDVVEDCDLPNKGREMVEVYHLEEEVWIIVNILSKPPKGEPYDPKAYFNGILEIWKATLIKIADRANNCTTMQVFDKSRREKYISETSEYIYALCTEGKRKYPQFSNIIKILENLIVSICESLASLSGMQEEITRQTQNYKEMIDFIEMNARKENMPNTYQALLMAQKFYEGSFRTSGDPFVIHPLRVSAYLMDLGIMDDITNASALLHEKAHWMKGADTYIRDSGISPEVMRIVNIVSDKSMPLPEYYKRIQEEPRAILEKLANRAHTCTFLAKASYKEMETYIRENQEYMVPLCEWAKKQLSQYANQIEIMQYHILSISDIVEAVTKQNRLTSKKGS